MTTEITVGSCTDLEAVVAALSPITHYFGRIPTAEDSGRFVSVLPVDRMLVARAGGRAVGGAGSVPFELTVPGGTVAAAGTTVVGVLPTHRRRGILRSLMRAQLDDIYTRREPVAYLWASEETIYGRFGYGMASWALDVTIPKPASFAVSLPGRGEIELLDEDGALAPCARIYDQVRLDHPGMFSRTRDWWTVRRLADPEARRAGMGVLNRAVLHLEGAPAAYALYRIQQSLESGVSSGHVSVIEAMGTTAEATREIWRFLLDIDWVATIKAGQLSLDHPLFFLLARPRLARIRMTDALWVRLVDVESALLARRFAHAEPVVIAVTDPFCPWNDGSYEVGSTGVARTDASPDLALGVDALGATYLGGVSFSALAAVARVHELRPGAIARADTLFSAARAPWCPEIF